MKEYRVTWAIDVQADSPKAAARIAWRIQHDLYSSATLFTVKHCNTGKTTKVELDAELTEGSV